MTEKQIEAIEREVSRASEDMKRKFLRRRVGRQLIAILLGKPGESNFSRADSYLYKGSRLGKYEILKVEECYLVAMIIDGLRRNKKNDENVAKNWLMLPCSYLEDHAPICAIRDGRSYNHLSAIGAAKTFVLR